MQTSPEQMLAYMRATVRSHNPQEINDWTIDELRAVYHLLPRPKISFQEWSERMGYSESPPPPEEMAEANDHFIAFAQNLNTPDISTTDENTHAESQKK